MLLDTYAGGMPNLYFGNGCGIMGFLDFIGNTLGKMAAMSQEILSLKGEYEHMSDNELKREYRDLKGRFDSDSRNRLKAVTMILKERRVIKNND